MNEKDKLFKTIRYILIFIFIIIILFIFLGIYNAATFPY